MLAWTTVALGVLSVWRATPGFRDPATDSTDIPVYLGPQLLLNDERPPTLVVVGYAPDPDTELGILEQAVGPMAGSSRPRDEAGTIECRVYAQTGDADVPGILQTADTAVSALTAAILADQTLRVVLGSRITHVGLSVAAPLLYRTTKGVACEWALAITYTARV